MKISEKFTKGKCVFSLEIFPPKKDMSPDTVYKTIDSLKNLKPAFISVTYGAGGTSGDNITGEVAAYIKGQGVDSAAHLTCVSNTRADIDILLEDFKAKGIENILALRGDINPERPPKHDFEHACDLVRYIKEKGDFHISGACYPECHTEAESFEADIARLKEKVDAGVTHLMSQLFFDNEAFYRVLDMAQGAGIFVAIEAGFMRVTNKKYIERLV
ncbi:MAG: methylenetetrahydrofolate reductase [Oscillospiraceae bacterium]|nr:methylenetetrahydrofolate reductase [Oscillospiraceae bacterium]